MKTPEQIAAEVAGSYFDTYQDSAEEVGHPEGQPIVETWPALRECIAAAIEADREQREVLIVTEDAGGIQRARVFDPADAYDTVRDLLNAGYLPHEMRWEFA